MGQIQRHPGPSLLQSAQDLRLGRGFTFQQDNDPKHSAKITKEWLQNNSVTVLQWPSQSPDFNPTEHLWRDLKMAVHQHSPSNLTGLERICRRTGRGSPNPGVRNLLHHSQEDSWLYYLKRCSCSVLSKGSEYL